MRKTEHLTIEKPDVQDSGIQRAAAILRDGGLVAIPTETVYGLAADALNPQAVGRIFEAKGRPSDNPLIVHIAHLEHITNVARTVPESADKLAKAFWPGPLTMVLPKASGIPDKTSGGLDTVGIRLPSHPVARAVIEAAGVPLAAPSANLSGCPSPTTASHVLADMEGRIEAVLDGGPCGVGVESTVLSLAGKRPLLLRPGGVTPEQIESVIGPIDIHPAVYHALEQGQKAESPGMKYKHYAPHTKVMVVKGDGQSFARYVNSRAGKVGALCFDEDLPHLHVPAVSYGRMGQPDTQAQGLFDALRRLDGLDADVVYARYPDVDGMGLAVYNRLMRAAAFEVIEL